ARHELALVLRDQGELDRARSELEAILAHRRDSLGDTHPDTLSTQRELGDLQQPRAVD
ncbi:tetratricopeptide repeat protein, partial [Streptomyces griseorubiginosus]